MGTRRASDAGPPPASSGQNPGTGIKGVLRPLCGGVVAPEASSRRPQVKSWAVAVVLVVVVVVVVEAFFV